jgi:prepilin-type N-terminal cleavage/methylation domain-containing protein
MKLPAIAESADYSGSSARASVPAGGFSLLELLVVITISAAMVVFLGLLYRNVLFTGTALQAVESDWLVERFLRRQLAFRDGRFDDLGVFYGSSVELGFVSRYSARYLASGPPVCVRTGVPSHSSRRRAAILAHSTSWIPRSADEWDQIQLSKSST